MPSRLSVLALAATLCSAQLPESARLSADDQASFQAEITRLQTLLSSAPDRPAITYQLARTWAAGQQWPETIDWLRKVAESQAGFDPSRDSAFAPLRGAREFESILASVRESTPPASHSRPAFVVQEGDLVPESIAYDPRAKNFYFGSMRKGKVIRCSATGNCVTFASGLGTVLGLKVHGDGLWLLSNSDAESALIHYDLASARMIRSYPAPGPGHNLNDLTIAPSGEVYLTDTRAGAVWRLANNAAALSRIPGQFRAANGIAVSPGNRTLYVSTFPDGITVVDLATGSSAPIARPANITLAYIDGLYFYRGALIAIQNGFMNPRVVRFTLDRSLRTIARLEVLERRNTLFNGVTTGVIASSSFFYMANIQDDKQSAFDPIAILKLHL